MNILGGIQILFGLFAIGSGAIVLRGILRRALSCKCTARFLEFSLLASIAGLMPLTRHLTPLQAMCMLSVYCSGTVILAWLKYRLASSWRSVFAFLIPVILYFNVASISVELLRQSPRFVRAAMGAHSVDVSIAQFLFALSFAVLGFQAARRFHAEPTRFPKEPSAYAPYQLGSLATTAPKAEGMKSSVSPTESRTGGFKVLDSFSALSMRRI
jgi:hypothetical protein